MHTTIKKIRNTLNWTQEQMSNVLGSKRSTYAQKEAGRNPFELIDIIKLQMIVDRCLPLFNLIDMYVSQTKEKHEGELAETITKSSELKGMLDKKYPRWD